MESIRYCIRRLKAFCVLLYSNIIFLCVYIFYFQFMIVCIAYVLNKINILIMFNTICFYFVYIYITNTIEF